MKYINTVLILLISLVFLASCSLTTNSEEQPLPDVMTLVEKYMEARKISTRESLPYIHFEGDFFQDAYLTSNERVLDYKIESHKKINDSLYAFTVLVKSTETNGKYLRAYNFVGLIDGQWLYMNGVANIPASLKENLVEEDYQYR